MYTVSSVGWAYFYSCPARKWFGKVKVKVPDMYSLTIAKSSQALLDALRVWDGNNYFSLRFNFFPAAVACPSPSLFLA